jgi:cbb3-type cytochrome oxidase maturation protein
MNGIVVLIPIALGLGLAGLAAFFWSIKDGQFDDPDGSALRILDDDDRPTP